MYNIHINGILSDALPYEDYPDGNIPLTYYSSRAVFEKTLRRLIYKPGGRIRWLVGTTTGLQQSSASHGRIESVTVRIGDSNEEMVIPTSLVVGM